MNDAQGHFRIDSVDASLLFRVLVVAKDFEPAFFAKVDPMKGPLDARLRRRAAPTLPASQIIIGRVVGPDKAPIANTVVSVEGTVIGDTTFGSPPKDTDPLSITDEAGRFEIRCPQPFDSMNLKVEARGWARCLCNNVTPGLTSHDLVLTRGAVLIGRLVSGDKPVGNVTLGVVQADRRGEVFFGDFVTGTDDDGRFAFLNLPPNREYVVYGLMNSLLGRGALPTLAFCMGDDGTTNDLGALRLTAGWRLAGKLSLSDSNAIPPHCRLVVGRDRAWDSTSVELAPDGHFSFTNLPGETLDLSARVNGYRVSAQMGVSTH